VRRSPVCEAAGATPRASIRRPSISASTRSIARPEGERTLNVDSVEVSASIRRLGDMLLPPPPLMLNRWNSLGSMMSSASTSAPPCTMRTRPTFRAQAEVFQRAERARNRILAIIGRVHRAAGVQNDRQGPALSIAARQHDIGAVALAPPCERIGDSDPRRRDSAEGRRRP
jgi:hypothetical protein